MSAVDTIRHSITAAITRGFTVAPYVRELHPGKVWTSGLTVHNGRYVASNATPLDALGALLGLPHDPPGGDPRGCLP
jgi:hypothetical protein